MVDEDTDLLDPVFQNGGKVNPQWKPSRNGFKVNQKGKPELPSKELEENITTDKKTNSGRTSSLFPRKPSGEVIDMDIESATKKPSVIFPVVTKIPSDPSETTDANKSREVTDNRSKFVSPTPHIITTQKAIVDAGRPVSTDPRDKLNNKLQEKEQPGTVTIIYRDRDLVLGPDGEKYRLQRGPPGPMGPPGKEVSGLKFFLFIAHYFSCPTLFKLLSAKWISGKLVYPFFFFFLSWIHITGK